MVNALYYMENPLVIDNDMRFMSSTLFTNKEAVLANSVDELLSLEDIEYLESCDIFIVPAFDTIHHLIPREFDYLFVIEDPEELILEWYIRQNTREPLVSLLNDLDNLELLSNFQCRSLMVNLDPRYSRTGRVSEPDKEKKVLQRNLLHQLRNVPLYDSEMRWIFRKAITRLESFKYVCTRAGLPKLLQNLGWPIMTESEDPDKLLDKYREQFIKDQDLQEISELINSISRSDKELYNYFRLMETTRS